MTWDTCRNKEVVDWHTVFVSCELLFAQIYFNVLSDCFVVAIASYIGRDGEVMIEVGSGVKIVRGNGGDSRCREEF